MYQTVATTPQPHHQPYAAANAAMPAGILSVYQQSSPYYPVVPVQPVQSPYHYPYAVIYASASTCQPSPIQEVPMHPFQPPQETPNQPVQSMQSTYQYNEDRLPVNTSGGTILTERVCIHISNLPKDAQSPDIERLLQKHHVNDYQHVTMLLDHHNNTNKQSTTITFATAQRAERAVGMLNGSNYRNRKLRVRIAKESRAVASQPYPIVNGSTY
jgi:RNA recognition motif-containing protein